MKDNFSTLGDILNNDFMSSKKMGCELNKSFAFKFWPNIVGKKFEKFSKPYSIKASTLYISVKNAAILQELSFFKRDILKKAQVYFEPLGIKVADIKFDYKNWAECSLSINNSSKEDYPLAYTKEELDSIALTDEEEKELANVAGSIDEITFLSPSLKEKYFNDILYQFKAKKLRNLKK